MNQFGLLFRLSVFGESHGTAVGLLIDGCPPGIDIDEADFVEDMERRKGKNQPGTTPRKEEDKPVFLSGIFKGKTTGAPLTIIFENKQTRSEDYEKQKDIARPGHADFVAEKKFKGFQDYRGGGHFSGRLTVCLVAAGVVAKKILKGVVPKAGIKARLVELGAEQNIEQGLQKALNAGDSVGGIVECTAGPLPIGWGEPFFNSVESLISHAVFSIPAIKGIEFGAGFGAAKMFGSQHNDPIMDASGKTTTNNSGGISGGLTNGNPLVFRVAVKPTSSTPQKQHSYNRVSGKMEDFSIKGRHDLSIALRVPVVIEAVTACVLLDLAMINKSLSQ